MYEIVKFNNVLYFGHNKFHVMLLDGCYDIEVIAKFETWDSALNSYKEMIKFTA